MICDLDKNDNSILTIKSKFLTITECHLQLGLKNNWESARKQETLIAIEPLV